MTLETLETDDNALVAALVRRAQAGDGDAFGALVERFERVVFAIALRRLRDYSEAEELTQDVLLQAFTKLDQLRDLHPDAMKSTVVWNIDETRRRPLSDMADAVRSQAEIHAGVVDFFGEYDVLACPVSQVPPFPVDTEWISSIDGVEMGNYIEWMRSCSDITVTGCPALSLPAGFTPDGLPVGIQLVAAHGKDRYLLQVAKALESAIDIERWPAIAHPQG